MFRILGLVCIVVVIGFVFTTPACEYDVLDPVEVPIDTSMSCPPDTVYFKKDILPIVLSSCGMALCHDAVTRQAGLVYTSYETILASGKVIPFNPMGSQFYTQMIETNLALVMPPSPRGPISDNNIAVVRKWIEQGAKNNDCIADTICTIADTVSFTQHVFPVIDKYCKGCHSGANPWAGLRLRNFSEVRAIATNGLLLGVINHDTGFPQMPRTIEKLDSCIIATITQWVNDGALDN